jgi:hypothetical protein
VYLCIIFCQQACFLCFSYYIGNCWVCIGFQIKFITNKFLFTGRCHFQLSNIRITKRFRLAGDDDYLRGATSINHQVALRANFKMYSRSAKGGERGNPTGKMFALEAKREVANRCHMRAFRCHFCLHFVDNMCSV